MGGKSNSINKADGVFPGRTGEVSRGTEDWREDWRPKYLTQTEKDSKHTYFSMSGTGTETEENESRTNST